MPLVYTTKPIAVELDRPPYSRGLGVFVRPEQDRTRHNANESVERVRLSWSLRPAAIRPTLAVLDALSSCVGCSSLLSSVFFSYVYSPIHVRAHLDTSDMETCIRMVIISSLPSITKQL